MNRNEACDIYTRLSGAYPDSLNTHHWCSTPYENLILTILSAQTTDNAVAQVKDALLSRFPTPESLAEGNIKEIEELIHRTGFYHTKALHIKSAAKVLVEKFGGVVPSDMDSLLTLPGVGRKTANIVLYKSFGKNEGIAIDTHVFRLAGRIGLSKSTSQDQVEVDLMKLYPNEIWGRLTDLFIAHGRRCCTARKPKCDICSVKKMCYYFSFMPRIS